MSDHPELHVAPPRGCNPQLSQDEGATFTRSDATERATGSLKALADKRLREIEGNRTCNPPATDETETVQLSGYHEAPEVAPEPETASRVEWLGWITAQVPLIRDDREYVWSRLATLPAHAMERAARRYVQTWTEAADAEPKPHRKENAGRRAANRTLLALIRPDSWRWRREHRKP